MAGARENIGPLLVPATMANILRASVVQACTVFYNLDDTLAKLECLTRLAYERDRSRLAVFPEAL